MLAHARGLPGTLAVLLFVLGAVAGFALVAAASFGGLRASARVQARPPALWGGLHVLSVGLATGAATAIAHLLEGLPSLAAWPLGGFTATVIYLAGLAAELALASG